MSYELTNLLPESYSKVFRRRYFLRLGTVVLVVLAIVVVLHGVFLFPSYVMMAQDADARSNELRVLSNAQQTQQEQQVQQVQTALKAETGYLLSFKNAPTASGVLRSVLAVPRSGVILTGFTYAAPTKGNQGNLQIQGIASTREALRTYDQALAALPYVTSADLPISDYASSNNIQFTITLTGSLQP